MQDPKRRFSSTSSSNDDLPEDDIDELFAKLEPVEPPSSLIAQILANVSHLQDAAQKKDGATEQPFEHLDTLVVRNEKKEPS